MAKEQLSATTAPRHENTLNQRPEFFHRHPGSANLRTQRAWSQFTMLWNREACHVSGLDEDHVASVLTILDPPRPLESTHASWPETTGSDATYAGTSISRTSIVNGIP